MSKEKKLYNKLESEVLNANKSSSSLISKAKEAQKNDRNFDIKISKTMDIIIDKMKHGDSIAYSICHTKYEKELDKIEESIYKDDGKDILKFLSTHNFLEHDTSSSFFDYKVAYIAEQFETDIMGSHSINTYLTEDINY